jgi:membrane protein DedA with SNARE-associated domain
VITVDDSSQRRVQVPIEAVSNGNAEIVATLYSSTGVQVGQSVTIQVNVNAGWETTGTLIFAALVAALFAFGIVRTIRRRRRAVDE